jgi:DNA-binding NtrC family response regulator
MLVIDDEEKILKAFGKYFKVQGFEVDCARETEEAQAMIAHIEYSVVIADLRLTGIQGAEGLEIVRYAKERCPQTRLVLLTAYGSPEIEKEARRRGADVFLHKPIPLGNLASIVSRLLEDE